MIGPLFSPLFSRVLSATNLNLHIFGNGILVASDC